MIPKIITVNNEESCDTVIEKYANELGIAPSHRIVVKPEKEELTVEQIHQLQKDTQVAFSKKLLVALVGVDKSSGEVQNSLLKSLEENSERIQYILVLSNPSRLLPTILSRCSLSDLNRSLHISHSDELTQDIFSFQNNTDVKKEEAIEKIDIYITNSHLNNQRILNYILHIRKLIVENNMNPVMALDAILIFLSKASTMNKVYE